MFGFKVGTSALDIGELRVHDPDQYREGGTDGQASDVGWSWSLNTNQLITGIDGEVEVRLQPKVVKGFEWPLFTGIRTTILRPDV